MERELVVARYKEDVRWVLESPIPCTLYNKGPDLEPDLEGDDNVDVVRLPVVGREAYTWLEHVVRNYDDLADWTFFVQGTPHAPGGPAGLWSRLDLPYVDTTPLTTEYLPDFPSPAIKALDRVGCVGGSEVRWGLADHHGGRTPEANREWLDAVWRQLFDGPRPDPWWFGYSAEYAVPRRRIVGRPLEYWAWLRDLVARDLGRGMEQTPASAWGFETAWAYLWGDPAEAPGWAIPPSPPPPAVGWPPAMRPRNVATPPRPHLLAMARDFGKAVVAHVADGGRMASPEAVAERELACQSCPNHDHVKDSCSACGCGVIGALSFVGLDLPYKRSWASSRCPLMEPRWHAEAKA